jgi:hypothetical protein
MPVVPAVLFSFLRLLGFPLRGVPALLAPVLARVLVSVGLYGLACSSAQAQDPSKPVYRCPGPPVLYTDSITQQEARERGCRLLEGAPITIVPAVRPRAASGASRAGDAKIDPAAQRARDSDARRILQDELQREQAKLAELEDAYNNGQPERLGSERNYARYQDRVAEMKAAIDRKADDVAALKRELAKLPQ